MAQDIAIFFDDDDSSIPIASLESGSVVGATHEEPHRVGSEAEADSELLARISLLGDFASCSDAILDSARQAEKKWNEVSLHRQQANEGGANRDGGAERCTAPADSLSPLSPAADVQPPFIVQSTLGGAEPAYNLEWHVAFDVLVSVTHAGKAAAIERTLALLSQGELGHQSDLRVQAFAGHPRPTSGLALADANIVVQLGQAEIVRLMVNGEQNAASDEIQDRIAQWGSQSVVRWWDFWFNTTCKRKSENLPAWKGLHDMLLYVRGIYYRQQADLEREEIRSKRYLAALRRLSPDKMQRLKDLLDSTGQG